MKHLLCISNDGGNGTFLTIGKVYMEIVDADFRHGYYKIISNVPGSYYFYEWRFIVIPEKLVNSKLFKLIFE